MHTATTALPKLRSSYQDRPRSYETWVWHAYQGEEDSSQHGEKPPLSWLQASQFHGVQFQFFVTVNPTHRMTIAALKALVKRFIEDSVHRWKTIKRTPIAIGYVAGYETRDSGGWKDPHIHMAVISDRCLDTDFIERRWRKIIGPNPKSLDVKPIMATVVDSGTVLKYCLKGADDLGQQSWDWEWSDNLDSKDSPFRPKRPKNPLRDMKDKFRR